MEPEINIKIEKIKEEKKDTLDKFSILSKMLAAIVGIFLLLDIFKIFILGATELVLLGGFIALLFLPYSIKIKFLGIEIQRLEKSKQ